MTTDPDRPCPHEDWAAFVDVARIADGDEAGPIVGYSVDLRIECTACSAPFVFYCADGGLRRDRPAISPNGQEIRLPGRPQDAPDTFGLNLPGFGINIGRGMAPTDELHPGVDLSDPDDHGLLQ